MYQVRNKVYADAGEILVGENKIGYIFLGELGEFSREEISLDDMRIEDNFIVYSNGRLRELYNPNMTYEQLKAKYIKRLFSNDDQIAIMLNKDRSEHDNELFNKMQEWRDWCGILAKKVKSVEKDVVSL
jgi:hypothetical protein